MKNVFEKMQEENAEQKKAFFLQKFHGLSYKGKVAHARAVAREFRDEAYEKGYNVHVSVGGLDSITLAYFLREDLGFHDVDLISCSGLEDRSIQYVHKLMGVTRLYPARHTCGPNKGKCWTKQEILQEFGFPVLSKEIAGKISLLENPSESNKTVRHAIITGETGEYGGFQKNSRMKLSNRWLKIFGGYENENEGTHYGKPENFLVSDKCCYYLKEKPCDDWAKEHHSVPYLGLMASEGGRRAKSLMMHGCNYWGESTIRSCPFAIFKRQELLQLALDLNVPVPEIYGTIERKPDGTLYTTKTQRTGCSMCGFGIHLEKRPHRFDQLRESNPKQWDYWMNKCCKDPDGTPYGWGRVLDYIGVEWGELINAGQISGQMSIYDFIEKPE
ncbi:MAG: hypothetical protein Q4A32_03450 [Lachnospiraceae bacterium]|nr:hypothetical protein [Lachnospiraceae bacterium]